jgi:hypothetical protein
MKRTVSPIHGCVDPPGGAEYAVLHNRVRMRNTTVSRDRTKLSQGSPGVSAPVSVSRGDTDTGVSSRYFDAVSMSKHTFVKGGPRPHSVLPTLRAESITPQSTAARYRQRPRKVSTSKPRQRTAPMHLGECDPETSDIGIESAVWDGVAFRHVRASRLTGFRCRNRFCARSP